MEEKICKFLLTAGFKQKHRGFEYIKYGIHKFIDNNYNPKVLGGALYHELSTINGKTSKTIEKNITCAIESAYLRGDMEYLGLMGLIFDNQRGRPTNSEFIATSAINLFLIDDN
ncbi:MAG: sporulation initiation factor Spo0A C-terminal domain-containing protein [Bacillota bacterium]